MAGNDPYHVADTKPPRARTDPEELADRKESARVRHLILEPNETCLATIEDGQRWLTDRYVMLDVTGSRVFRDLDDGWYKLTVGKGPQPIHPDYEVLTIIRRLTEYAKFDWLPVVKTNWPSPQRQLQDEKGWLVYVEEPVKTLMKAPQNIARVHGTRHPFAINIELWEAFSGEAEPPNRIEFQHKADSPGSPFRVVKVVRKTETREVLGYIAPIVIPDGRYGTNGVDERKTAQYVVDNYGK